MTTLTRPPVPAKPSRKPAVAAVAIATLLCAAAAYVVAFTGVVGVRTVTVLGAHALTADQVRTAAGLRDGEPLARVDLGRVQRQVGELAGVQRVAVTRSWPHTVRITVTERTGIALVSRDGALWLVDPAGVVFQRLTVRPHLPLLAVPDVGPDDPAAMAALTALAALKDPVPPQVAQVKAPTPEQVTLYLTGGRTVLWGGGEDSAAKASVLTELLKRPGTYFDVSTPSVVTVR